MGTRISQFTPLTTVASADYFPLVQASDTTNKRVSLASLLASVPLGSAATPSIAFTGDTNTGIFSPGADQVAISTSGTSRLSIDASGNIAVDTNTLYVDAVNNRVGIGTSSPSFALDCRGAVVAGNGTIQTGLSFSTRSEIGSVSNHNLGFMTNSATQMLLDTSGRLGIGTTSPSYVLDVSGGAGNGIRYQNTANSIGVQLGASSASVQIGSTTSHPVEFLIGSVERARIDSSGRLLVGTSSAGAGALTTTTIIGALLMKSTGLRLISQGGTLDLDLSEGTGIVGHLYVSSTRDANAAAKTNATYFISTRQGNNTAITLLNSNNGSTSGSSFTITNPSANIFRFTDTAAGGSVDVSMSFVGTIAF